MGTLIFRPVSDIDTTAAGDWELSNSNMSFATALTAFDDDFIYMKGKTGFGKFTIQMALDESTLISPAVSVTDMRVTGIYSSGKNMTEGSLSVVFDAWPDTPDGPLSFSIDLQANQTNATFSARSESWTQSGDEDSVVANWTPLTLYVSGTHTASSSAKTGAMSIDQIVVEMDYNPLPSYLYIRQNNTWKQCAPYKKINGVWVQQDASFLGSSNIAQLYYKGG